MNNNQGVFFYLTFPIKDFDCEIYKSIKTHRLKKNCTIKTKKDFYQELLNNVVFRHEKISTAISSIFTEKECLFLINDGIEVFNSNGYKSVIYPAEEVYSDKNRMQLPSSEEAIKILNIYYSSEEISKFFNKKESIFYIPKLRSELLDNISVSEFENFFSFRRNIVEEYSLLLFQFDINKVLYLYKYSQIVFPCLYPMSYLDINDGLSSEPLPYIDNNLKLEKESIFNILISTGISKGRDDFRKFDREIKDLFLSDKIFLELL